VWQRFPIANNSNNSTNSNKNIISCHLVVEILIVGQNQRRKIKSMLNPVCYFGTGESEDNRFETLEVSVTSINNIDHTHTTQLSMLGLIKDLVFRADKLDKELSVSLFEQVGSGTKQSYSYRLQNLVSAELGLLGIIGKGHGREVVMCGRHWSSICLYQHRKRRFGHRDIVCTWVCNGSGVDGHNDTSTPHKRHLHYYGQNGSPHLFYFTNSRH
jgi:hypothetical protein